MAPDLEAARALLERGRFPEALAAIGSADALSGDERRLRALCLAGLGRYEDSLDELDRASAVADQAGDTASAVAADLERGRLFVRLGRPRDALRVLAGVPTGRMPAELAPAAYTVVADAYTELGDWQRAEDMCDAAALAARQVYGESVSNPDAYRVVAGRKLAIARLAARTGRHRRALYVLAGIEAEGRFGAQSPLVAPGERPRFTARLEALRPEVDLQAGDSLAAVGDLEQSRDRYRRARAAARAREDSAVEVEATTGEGIVALRAADHEEALRCLRAALESAERWHDEFGSADHRIGLRGRQARLYDALVDLAVAVADAPLAWRFAELSRAREFLLAIHRGAPEPVGTDPSLQTIATLSAEIAAVSASLTTAGLMDERFGELREHREQLLQEKARAIEEIRRRDRLGEQTVRPPIVELDEVVRVLGADTALVQYHLTSESAIAVVLTSAGASLIALPGSPAAIRRRVQRYVRLVSEPDSESATGESWREISAHLYGWLWDPVLPYLTDRQRVCIVAHGPLQALPFGTLGRDEPLLSQFEVVYVPSSSVLVALADRRPPGAGTVSVFANPLSDNPRYNLPAARYEAAAIAAKDLDVAVSVGADATAARVREAAGAADILHLACHAEYDLTRPLLTALLLAPEGSAGRLEVHDIYRLAVRASLVVLSACDTARAEDSPGTELEGLVRSFMAAGAASVIGSQWVVRDAATAQLMGTFYAQLAAGVPPARALRTAQLELSRDARYAHPYFWGAFALHGRW